MNHIKFLVIGLLFVSLATTTSCEKEDNVKDPIGNTVDDDNPDNNNGDNDNNDDNGGDDNQNTDYPYISGIALFIFDGDDPMTDDEPIFSFSDIVKVSLNPAGSCQMDIEKYKDITEGDISGAWSLELFPGIVDIATDNSCFNEPREVTAAHFEESIGSPSIWNVELIPPNGSPYKILYYDDGEIKLYRDISTDEWDGSQGSIDILPSTTFYTDPNYGVLPKKVTFTFNNVTAGYLDENNVKKAVRIVGVIEITKQD